MQEFFSFCLQSGPESTGYDAAGIFVLLLIPLFFIDLKHHRLPNVLTFAWNGSQAALSPDWAR